MRNFSWQWQVANKPFLIPTKKGQKKYFALARTLVIVLMFVDTNLNDYGFN